MKKLKSFSGILLFLSFIISILYEFKLFPTLLLSGIFATLASFILFNKLVRKQKIFILTLCVLGSVFWTISYNINPNINLEKLITSNQFLLTLLLGVHYLRLITFPKNEKLRQLPTCKNAFFRTYMGVHLFGAVINLSALFLVADNLYKRAKLTKEQLIVLTRAFSSDAYWSPFFAAFAAALTYASDTKVEVIFSFGIPLSLITFFITYYELKNSNDYSLNNFTGFPISMQTIWLPLLLLFLVSLTHYIFPDLKVVILIAFFCLVITLIVLSFRYSVTNGLFRFWEHTTQKLPSMYAELILFLVAGLFGTGISTLLLLYNISLPFESLNGFSASFLLLVILALSFIGVHPIISISILGNWLSSIDANHTLMAMMFLMSWAIAVGASPISGMNLAIQGRYQVSAKDIFSVNALYAVKMYLICSAFLFAISYYLGI